MIRKHIPNTITCCNLLSGCAAVYMAAQQQYAAAFLLILLGAFFDFFDGMSARLLGVSNPIGKEMDSLADVITFGLAPGMAAASFLRPVVGWWALLSLLMVAFSALRLAKFNLDERQTTSFLGLATPPNAIFWASLTAFLHAVGYAPLWLGIVLVGYSFLSCWLLVSEIPFFSLKFHNLAWADNRLRYVFIIGSVVLVFALAVCAAEVDPAILLTTGAVVIFWYVLLALCTARTSRTARTARTACTSRTSRTTHAPKETR